MRKQIINDENIKKYLIICDSFREGYCIVHEYCNDKIINEGINFVKKRYSELKSENDFMTSSFKAKTELFKKMFGVK